MKRKYSGRPRTKGCENCTTSWDQEKNQQKERSGVGEGAGMRGRHSPESWKKFFKRVASNIKDRREAKAMRHR